MTCAGGDHPHLVAISDLHVGHAGNRDVLAALRPRHDDDWLLVPGDLTEDADELGAVLDRLTSVFARVVWSPGNHELWSPPNDASALRGQERYDDLVTRCRARGVVTPEDPYPRWTVADRAVAVVPTFLLYDYSFHSSSVTSEQALDAAYRAGHVFHDDALLHPDPFPTRSAWCRARVAATEERLDALPDDVPIVVVNHYPLRREPTRRMFSPHLPLWCGTSLTEHWHRRYPIETVVYGHLHLPSSEEIDGVRYEEVSLGYPREWRPRADRPGLRTIRCGS